MTVPGVRIPQLPLTKVSKTLFNARRSVHLTVRIQDSQSWHKGSIPLPTTSLQQRRTSKTKDITFVLLVLRFIVFQVIQDFVWVGLIEKQGKTIITRDMFLSVFLERLLWTT